MRKASRLVLSLLLVVAIATPAMAVGKESRSVKPVEKQAKINVDGSGTVLGSQLSAGAVLLTEPTNDNISGAEIPAASTIVGTLDELSDTDDVYAIELSAGERLIASIQGPVGTDFDLILCAPGSTDAFPDMLGGALSGTYPDAFGYVVPTTGSGTYYLDAWAAVGAGEYTLTYSIELAGPDDTIPGVAIPISPTAGTLDEVSDRDDVYAIDLSAGQRLTASIQGPADTDFDLYLYAPSSTDVSSDPWVAEASGVTYPDGFEYVVPATGSGTYYLDAWAAVGAGEYTVTYTVTTTQPPVPTPAVLTPVAGANRIGTAIAASKLAYPAGSQYVVIATAANWPDALGGSALAGAYDGPILLTNATSLPAEVAAEITRLGATDAIILGGTGAVSAGVEGALNSALGDARVQRIGGTNRYETANMVATATVRRLGAAFTGTAFVATGANFPDALGASPLAAAKGWPIYLANPASADNASLAATMKADGVSKALVLGGTSVVSGATDAKVKATVGASTRLSGANRYATAIAVAKYGVANAGLSWDKVAIATGANFPDALAGGVLQATSGSVMLLTPSTTLDAGVASTLGANKAAITEVRFLGGTGALSNTVRTSVATALK